MAIRDGEWNIISEKQRKANLKPTKKNGINSNVWQKVWFLYDLDLYEGVITWEPDDEHYMVEATNKNIHTHNEKQTSIQPRNNCRFYND